MLTKIILGGAIVLVAGFIAVCLIVKLVREWNDPIEENDQYKYGV